MNKQKESYVRVTINALIANDAAENSPVGSLAKKHAGQIALRYALRSDAMYRANRLKTVLIASGVILLVSAIIYFMF